MPRFPSLKIEGGLLSADLIEKIFAGETIAQKPQDFNLPGSESAFSDYLAFLWNKTRELWENFQKRLETLPPDDPATSLTRERFVIPLLELLDYKPTYQREAVEVDGKRFPLSHRADPSDEAPFIHIVGARQNLDRLQHGSRLSPHALVQEFLNKTEHLWAIVTNGEILRLLRDTQLIARQAFIEFNLKEMFSNELFADFQLFFRLVHRSRLPKSISDANECPLEKYHRESIEQGNRIRDKLRDSVEKALNILGTAILQHPKNNAIKEDVKNKKIKPDEFYQQLLRLIYRILFLLVAEERNLIGGTNIFRNYYSISRLRKLTEVKSAWVEHHDDLWINLQKTFEIFADENKAQKLGVAPLNGELFNPSNTNIINNARVNNADLLKALWYLCWFKPDDKSPLQRVNYAQLDVEELGSIYESLLDFHPTFKEEGNKLAFELTTAGTERKSTGSYYTPRSLVGELIKSALEPVLNEKLTQAKRIPKKDGENPAEKAILSIKVLDPACGSGHFLLAAARRLATELAKIRTGEEQPNPTDYKLALRDVVRHCIYGVDKNPLAVELCKVALWIESHAEGKPLAFLDHHIKCGDSLVGVLSINSIENGIPDDAYEPVAGDDKNIARKLKNQNKENKKYKYQYPLELKYEEDLKQIEKTIQTFIEIPDDEPEQIREKDKLYKELQKGPSWWKYKTLCNLWTAPFFAEFTKENEKKIPTSNAIFTLLNSRSATTIRGDISAYAEALALKHRFFHWELEFPEVFSQGGFDVVLGNPPFMGGLKISGTLGDKYRQYLEIAFAPFKGTADLCSAFYRRAFNLLKPGGRMGMVATNTIGQGDTRESGLAVIVKEGGKITFAKRFIKWPGAANVEVNLIAIHKPDRSPIATHYSPILDGQPVKFISSRLDDEPEAEPKRLPQNEGRAFQGDIVRGIGFVLEPEEAEELLTKNPRNADCLFPYLNGEDLNSHPEQKPSRYVICFHDWDLERAKQYPDLLRIVEERVKPERERLHGPGDKRNREYWWQFAAYRQELRRAIAHLKRVLVRAE
jgi:hypothetical protein